MLRVLPLLLALAVVVYALIDCLQTDSRRVRRAPKPMWLLAIVLLPVLGALGWLIAGRPPGARPSRPVRRPLAPDDDPDFLRWLRRQDPPPEEPTR